MYNDINAIILSGGKSSRMGENKSLMKIGNLTIIERVIGLLNPLFDSISLITNTPEDYSFLDVPKFLDIYPGKGPLSGIHSGLFHSENEKNFVFSCDIPLMKKEMIEYLINYLTDKPITIARADGYLQQLCGLFHKKCLNAAEQILKESINEENRHNEQKKRGCKVLDLVNLAGAEIINAESLPFYEKDMYFNMNRKEEYEYVRQKLRVNN